MTADLLDLARSIMALPGWRLMAEMRVRLGDRSGVVIWAGEGAAPIVGWEPAPERLCHATAAHPADLLPDLASPGTGGCLLELLNENPWESRGLLGSGWTAAKTGETWEVWLNPNPPFVARGATLAEACARAALSLGRWPGGEG